MTISKVQMSKFIKSQYVNFIEYFNEFFTTGPMDVADGCHSDSEIKSRILHVE